MQVFSSTPTTLHLPTLTLFLLPLLQWFMGLQCDDIAEHWTVAYSCHICQMEVSINFHLLPKGASLPTAGAALSLGGEINI